MSNSSDVSHKGPRSSEISEPALTRGLPGNFFKPILPGLGFIYLPHVYFLYRLFLNRALCFQVTVSHQGTLLRCGWYWKIKQTIPATHNRVAHLAESHETSTVCRIRSSVKVMPWAGQVLPTSTPKMPLADRHNLMCVCGGGVSKQCPRPRGNLLQFLVSLLRAPAISFHLIHSQGLSEQSAAVMVTGISKAAL